MMADHDLILSSLEALADRLGDPQQAIYDRLFEMRPDYEELFIMDPDGGVRGTMLHTCFDCIIGLAEGNDDVPRFQLDAARIAHDAYGLEGDDVQLMFVAIRDVVRAELAEDWSDQHAQAWARLLDGLEAFGHENA